MAGSGPDPCGKVKKEGMNKKVVTGIAVGMAAVLAVGGIAVYSRMGKGETKDIEADNSVSAVAVSAGLPEVGELAVTGTYIGTVSPEEMVNVIPLVSGEVTEVNFEVGDYVEAGSVLVRVDDEAARIQLQSAQLNKEAAQLNADRTLGSTMYSSNLSMVANIQGIESQIEMARKQYEAAGDSVQDAKQAKEDLQEALNTINENISKMESGYGDMQKLAASAKQLVDQDEYLRWRWKVDLLKEELADLKAGAAAQQNSIPMIPPVSGNSIQITEPVTDVIQPAVPDVQEQTGENEQDDPAAEDETEDTENKDEKTDIIPADDGEGSDTAMSGYRCHAVSADVKNMGNPLSLEEIRSHKNPRRMGTAENLTVQSGSDKYSVMMVSDSAGSLTAPDIQIEMPDPQIAILEAQIAALEPATKQIQAMGYSAADIGEGRVDSSVTAYASQIATLKSQAATLESNIKSMDGTIRQAEMSQETTADTIGVYKDNLKTAQTQYFHQNNQAYADNAAALQNQVNATEIGIASAQMQLENYVLTAPISGYIEQKNVADHGMVSAGNPVYVISNKDSMTITFYVSEAVRNQLVIGQSVMLERTNEEVPAAITEIGQSVDARTGLFAVKASTSEGNLTNGVTVQVHVATEKVTDAILIPYDAVYFEGDKAFVYCVKNNILVKTEVVTGLADEDTIEITEGLSKDDLVVNSWSPQLADGVNVRLIEEAE